MPKGSVLLLMFVVGAAVGLAVQREGVIRFFTSMQASTPSGAIASPGAPVPQRPGDKQDLQARDAHAWQLVHDEHLQEAQNAFLEILQNDPRDADAMRGLVVVRRLSAHDDLAILQRQAAAYKDALDRKAETDEHYTPSAMQTLLAATERAAAEIRVRGPQTDTARERPPDIGSVPQESPAVPPVATTKPLAAAARDANPPVDAVPRNAVDVSGPNATKGANQATPKPSAPSSSASTIVPEASHVSPTPSPPASSPPAPSPPASSPPAPSPPPVWSIQISPPADVSPQDSDGSRARAYTVEIGPLSDATQASDIAAELLSAGFAPTIVSSQTGPPRFRAVSQTVSPTVAAHLIAVLAERGIQGRLRALPGDLAQVEFGAFDSQADAEALARRIRALGHNTRIVQEGATYAVRLPPGPLPSIETITKIAKAVAPDVAVQVHLVR